MDKKTFLWGTFVKKEGKKLAEAFSFSSWVCGRVTVVFLTHTVRHRREIKTKAVSEKAWSREEKDW